MHINVIGLLAIVLATCTVANTSPVQISITTKKTTSQSAKDEVHLSYYTCEVQTFEAQNESIKHLRQRQNGALNGLTYKWKQNILRVGNIDKDVPDLRRPTRRL
jgi:hypothetical protein